MISLSQIPFVFFSGNEVEWAVPENIDLQGVEFKALVSGLHTITQDFVLVCTKFFTREQLAV